MNKALMKRIFYFVERFFSLALILFAVYVFCYGVISLAIFNDFFTISSAIFTISSFLFFEVFIWIPQ